MSKNYRIGVDVSTKKIAFAVRYPDGSVTCFEHTAAGKYADDRFVELVRFFDGQIRQLYPYVGEAVIEDVPFVRNRAGTIDLAQQVGAVMAVCALNHIPVRLVNNMTWKAKLGVGKRKGVKTNILKYVQEHYPSIECTSQDCADAICISEYAERTAHADPS